MSELDTDQLAELAKTGETSAVQASLSSIVDKAKSLQEEIKDCDMNSIGPIGLKYKNLTAQ